MRPQLQKFMGADSDEYGDCHRTCVAMILNMDRDEVPHFMQDLRPGTPADDPASLECVRREEEWLRQHGLGFVYVAFPGELELQELVDHIDNLAHGCPVVLGCRTLSGNHSVVLMNGEITNPSFASIVGPMLDGFWWITIYSVGPNWMSRQATRELSFTEGWRACEKAALSGDNPSRPGLLEAALSEHLQPELAPASVAGQETDADGN